MMYCPAAVPEGMLTVNSVVGDALVKSMKVGLAVAVMPVPCGGVATIGEREAARLLVREAEMLTGKDAPAAMFSGLGWAASVAVPTLTVIVIVLSNWPSFLPRTVTGYDPAGTDEPMVSGSGT